MLRDLATITTPAAALSEPVIHRYDRRLGCPWLGRVVEVYSHAAVAEPARLPTGQSASRLPPGESASHLPPGQSASRLTLLHPGGTLVPFGVELAWVPTVLTPGARVHLRDDVLTVSGPLGEQRWRFWGAGVELTARAFAHRAHTSLRALDAQLESLQPGLRVRHLVGEETVDQTAGLQSRLLRVTALRLARLLHGICAASRAAELARAARRLVGLGQGSTPTGDDLLVGAAAATFRLAACGWLPALALERLRSALGQLPRAATTRVGHEMIAQAARGAFPEPLIDFAVLLGNTTTGPRQMARATDRLLRMGSTSGADLLAGAYGLARRAVALAQGERIS